MANSTGIVVVNQKRNFKSDCPSLIKREQKHRTPLLEPEPVLLEGAALGTPKIF